METPQRNATLVFLIKRKNGTVNEICLAMKKRGFGANRWNGMGGKVEAGETIEAAARRETQEEIGVTVGDLEKVAALSFTFPHNPSWNQTVHAYFCETWQGEPQESDEMAPAWFTPETIPYTEMWPDDIFWLPEVIKGNFVHAQFSLGEKDVILNQQIEIVPIDTLAETVWDYHLMHQPLKKADCIF